MSSFQIIGRHKALPYIIVIGLFVFCSWIYLHIIEAQIIKINSSSSSSLSSSSLKTEAMSGSIYRAVLVTVPTLEIGKKIAHGVVQNKLAACVNIIPQVTSIYEWEGKIEEDSELLLIIKTQASHFEELSKFVQENHPASVPEVISLPIDQGSKAYLDWIKTVTTKK